MEAIKLIGRIKSEVGSGLDIKLAGMIELEVGSGSQVGREN